MREKSSVPNKTVKYAVQRPDTHLLMAIRLPLRRNLTPNNGAHDLRLPVQANHLTSRQQAKHGTTHTHTHPPNFGNSFVSSRKGTLACPFCLTNCFKSSNCEKSQGEKPQPYKHSNESQAVTQAVSKSLLRLRTMRRAQNKPFVPMQAVQSLRTWIAAAGLALCAARAKKLRLVSEPPLWEHSDLLRRLEWPAPIEGVSLRLETPCRQAPQSYERRQLGPFLIARRLSSSSELWRWDWYLLV